MRNDIRTSNRVLFMMETAVRQANRAILDPMVPELTPKSVQPIVDATARVRGEYLLALFKVAETAANGRPSPEAVKHLRDLRVAYDEMTHAYQALEHAIERGYLSVKE